MTDSAAGAAVVPPQAASGSDQWLHAVAATDLAAQWRQGHLTEAAYTRALAARVQAHPWAAHPDRHPDLDTLLAQMSQVRSDPGARLLRYRLGQLAALDTTWQDTHPDKQGDPQ